MQPGNRTLVLNRDHIAIIIYHRGDLSLAMNKTSNYNLFACWALLGRDLVEVGQ